MSVVVDHALHTANLIAEMFIVSSKSHSFSGPFYVAVNKEYLMKRQINFRCVNSAFPRLYFLKFSLKLANISRSYEENKTDLFFRSRCRSISYVVSRVPSVKLKWAVISSFRFNEVELGLPLCLSLQPAMFYQMDFVTFYGQVQCANVHLIRISGCHIFLCFAFMLTCMYHMCILFFGRLHIF